MQRLFESEHGKRSDTLARKNQCDISNQVAVEPGAVACFFLLNLTRQSQQKSRLWKSHFEKSWS